MTVRVKVTVTFEKDLNADDFDEIEVEGEPDGDGDEGEATTRPRTDEELVEYYQEALQDGDLDLSQESDTRNTSIVVTKA